MQESREWSGTLIKAPRLDKWCSHGMNPELEPTIKRSRSWTDCYRHHVSAISNETVSFAILHLMANKCTFVGSFELPGSCGACCSLTAPSDLD